MNWSDIQRIVRVVWAVKIILIVGGFLVLLFQLGGPAAVAVLLMVIGASIVIDMR